MEDAGDTQDPYQNNIHSSRKASTDAPPIMIKGDGMLYCSVPRSRSQCRLPSVFVPSGETTRSTSARTVRPWTTMEKITTA